uniref:Uncharacterized protein n=1 Tax=Brassica oleracea TaxID=3712 RepID=A0A3P6DI71_BRAOL|nr:unnamed protein product [Brassica oleracea]
MTFMLSIWDLLHSFSLRAFVIGLSTLFFTCPTAKTVHIYTSLSFGKSCFSSVKLGVLWNHSGNL